MERNALILASEHYQEIGHLVLDVIQPTQGILRTVSLVPIDPLTG
jgi:hypothetical protein